MLFEVIDFIDIYSELKKYFQLFYKKEVPYKKEILQEQFPDTYETLFAFYEQTFSYHEIIQAFGITIDTDFELLFHPFTFNNNACLASILSTESSITEEEKLLTLNDLLNKNYTNTNQVLDYLLTDNNLNVESKYRLILYLNHSDDLVEKLANYMAQYTPLIELLNKEVDNFLADFNHTYDEQKFHQYLANHFPELASYDSFTIRPVMLFENSFTVSLKNFDTSILFIDLSNHYLEISAIEHSSDRIEQIFLETTKILSDKIKFEILKACVTEEKFGAQLAKELNISTALVSYHLQPLVNHHYVISNVKNKRIYYITNPDKIKKDLNLIDQLLN